MPLTQEQFKKARDSGFTTEQIISFEKRRGAEAFVESPAIPESKPFIGDLLPKFSATANVGDQTTITPTDIVAGTVPLKGMRALTTGLAGRAKSALGTEKLSNEPIMPKTGLLPISPVNIGAIAGARAATPRAIAEGAIDIASTPETYMGIEALRPGIISKPLQALESKVARILPKTAEKIGEGVGILRDYPANKVNAIRESFWNGYAPQEWSAYGKAIEELPKSGTSVVKGDIFIQNLEKNLADKGLMSSEGNLQKAFTPADNKLLKAYDNIQRKWADSPSGELDVGDIVNEYKNLRGKYTGKPTPAQRQNIEAANTFFNAVSDQIDNEVFSAAKARYRIFKNNQEMIHGAVDLYGSGMKTAKGERFLTEGALSKTAQGRKTGLMITEKTGQGLKGAKAITLGHKVNPLNWLKR